MGGPSALACQQPDRYSPSELGLTMTRQPELDGGSSTVNELEQSDYCRELDRLIEAAFASNERSTLADVVRSCEGAFPTDIVRRIRSLGFAASISPSDIDLRDRSKPELHVLDFEWPFSRQTVDGLCELIGARSANLIGLPNIAESLDQTDSVLVERNPFAITRNPRLARRGNFVIKDVLDLKTADIEAREVVAFDAPWYYDEVLLWLSRAASIVQRPGLILFTLFPRLTRPSAEDERGLVLSYAERLGKVRVHHEAVSYVTPRFEFEALVASNVPPLNAWRIGDLVTVEVSGRSDMQLPLLGRVTVARENWQSFRVGSQVVKLRRSQEHRRAAKQWIGAVNQVVDWRLPSVSARDERRRDIDLWTSRNRVATVFDYAAVTEVLERVRINPTRSWAERTRDLRRSGHADSLNALKQVLDLGRLTSRQSAYG